MVNNKIYCIKLINQEEKSFAETKEKNNQTRFNLERFDDFLI